MENALQDSMERKKKGLTNKNLLISKNKKIEIINKVEEQLRALLKDIHYKLIKYEREINKANIRELDDLVYEKNLNEFVQYNSEVFTGIDLKKSVSPKIIVLLSNPTLSQLKNKSIIISESFTKYNKYYAHNNTNNNGYGSLSFNSYKEYYDNLKASNKLNDNFSNFLFDIEEKLIEYGKNYQFLFAVPFFLEEGDFKQNILKDTSLTNPIQRYTKDLILAMDPDYIIAVGNPAFEKVINKFTGESDTRQYKKQGSSMFYSYVQDTFEDELYVNLTDSGKKTRVFYCPHPFLLHRPADQIRFQDQERWDDLWIKLDNELTPGTKYQGYSTFINKNTNTANYDVTSILNMGSYKEYEKIEKKQQEKQKKSLIKYKQFNKPKPEKKEITPIDINDNNNNNNENKEEYNGQTLDEFVEERKLQKELEKMKKKEEADRKKKEKKIPKGTGRIDKMFKNIKENPHLQRKTPKIIDIENDCNNNNNNNNIEIKPKPKPKPVKKISNKKENKTKAKKTIKKKTKDKNKNIRCIDEMFKKKQ